MVQTQSYLVLVLALNLHTLWKIWIDSKWNFETSEEIVSSSSSSA
jgi:hypothetical protein